MSAAPSALANNEFKLFDEESFHEIDKINSVLNSSIEKTKCTLNVVDGIVGEGQLRNSYEKFHMNVETILKNDVRQCTQTEELIEKMK